MNKKSILIFGAGKIGRSFIGQLFGNAGYEVVFADVTAATMNDMNTYSYSRTKGNFYKPTIKI